MAAEKYVNVRVRAGDYKILRTISNSMAGKVSITNLISMLVAAAHQDGVRNTYVSPKETKPQKPAPDPKPRRLTDEQQRVKDEQDAAYDRAFGHLEAAQSAPEPGATPESRMELYCTYIGNGAPHEQEAFNAMTKAEQQRAADLFYTELDFDE